MVMAMMMMMMMMMMMSGAGDCTVRDGQPRQGGAPHPDEYQIGALPHGVGEEPQQVYLHLRELHVCVALRDLDLRPLLARSAPPSQHVLETVPNVRHLSALACVSVLLQLRPSDHLHEAQARGVSPTMAKPAEDSLGGVLPGPSAPIDDTGSGI